jgi:cobalt-zinc-cadmium efflux system membrane fusion protein
MTRRWWKLAAMLSAALVLAINVAGCQPPAVPAAAAKSAAPAKVGTPTKEADLATIKLTEEAETRLALTLVPVELKKVPRTASYGGEVIIPTGRLIVVASPFIGLLKTPPDAQAPSPGTRVKLGQPIFVLQPILSPESRATMAPLLVEADGQVKQAEEALKARKIEFDRQENLLAQKLTGQAALVDAKGTYDLARATLRAAEQRREILTKVVGDIEGGKSNAQLIEAPASGMIQNVHALTGQVVAAGALLFDIASLDQVWVKVPVYVGDLSRLDSKKDAEVGGLADVPGSAVKQGKPISAPPAGDPLAATVHIFYQVENKDASLRPGQRVNVILPLRGEEQSLVVPQSAVVLDYHGGNWVYEKTAPHTYARRRVVVDRVIGKASILAKGPKPGVKVVADGAAELWGTEFGGSK